MKPDNGKRTKSNIVIYLLFIVVLIVLLVVYYMEKSSLEAKISEAASQCSELSEQLDDASLKLKHKQNEIDYLYGKTDLAEQLASSMKTLKIQLPTAFPILTAVKYPTPSFSGITRYISAKYSRMTQAILSIIFRPTAKKVHIISLCPK